MDKKDELTILYQAIETLYTMFASYPFRPHMESSTLGITTEDQQRLATIALRSLNADDLRLYMAKAMTAWGDSQDFRHFLPRILEIVALENYEGYPDIPLIFGKLQYGQWHEWPAQEQAAVHAYLIALWRYVLVEYAPYSQQWADEYLCAIAQAVDNLTPFLKIWQQSLSLPAIWQLAAFINLNCRSVGDENALWNTFWENRIRQMQQVTRWLYTRQVVQTLEAGFYQYRDEVCGEEISMALDAIIVLLTTPRQHPA